ncbi:MAG: methyltransferase domain-containing protein [Desulfovibrio sp.]|jgi:SAM-dependent methyltransferase|nr:methyltransferase domain-containing protein [Desulfovibrio sp.]
MNINYSKFFYRDTAAFAYDSAKVIIEIIKKNIYYESVIDVGCGSGAWLNYIAHTSPSVRWHGLDFVPYDEDLFIIPREHYTQIDLNKNFSTATPESYYDLVLSLEVAEHLQPSTARSFISNLVNLSRQIVFSAAVPFQGGTGHVNEQWPEYWASLFREHNYFPVDCFRPTLWSNDKICGWYIQNIFLYIEKNLLDECFPEYNPYSIFPMSCIHPYLYYWTRQRNYPIAQHSYELYLKKYFNQRKLYENNLHLEENCNDISEIDTVTLLELTTDQLAQLHYELDAAKSKLAEQDVQLINTNSNIIQIKNELNKIKAELSERDLLLSKLNEDLKKADEECLRVYNSKSWRMTAPLRVIRSLIR